ncbi:hypothetical protein GO988_17855 [Hymenobacter sp. HMF4947]|uniref:Lipocalin-like domain-containing protein n=1 Tax=Hymenobacter ginkgonis TaxID=2682976 RepID=A0A7K1TIH1_9BACT|nr:hypothetical protein [Hymenobacter ginkgonis]MVN78197.1 hypothetical protein [Hymenobacter ginkgonis]
MLALRYSTPLAGLLLLVLAACHPDHPAQLPAGTLATLHGTWLLVPENSHADTLAYRRNTYRFRYRPGGRPGFRLAPAGHFVRYDVAPGGGLVAQEGTWTETSTGRLLIHLPEVEPAEPDYELEVLSYQQGVLRLRRLAGRPAVEIIRNH